MPVEIENVPQEGGEEVSVSVHDDGTLSSTVMSSTAEKEEACDESVDSVAEDGDDEKEEEEAAIEEAASETEDREFDKNPTVLYALVQKKLWKEAAARAKTNPVEARAFIVRKEKNGKIRWRLLPIHAAIVFKAPEDVIHSLLTAFPKSAEEKDDQGMLPLHLSLRNSASREIVNMLLMAFPGSVDSLDRKSRLPLTLAQNAESPLREQYITALEKGASHYSVFALAYARERIIAEQKEIYDAQLKEALKMNESAFSEMEASVEEKKKEAEEIVAEKEKELVKIHENSEVLVDHVASLEAQLGCRSDTERFLATKIAKLEEKIKENEVQLKERDAVLASSAADTEEKLQKASELKEKTEGEFKVENAKLIDIIAGLEAKLEEMNAAVASTETKLQESIDSFKEKQDEWDMKEIRGDAKYTKVEIDWANSQANVAILESQLKKRMENEHLLASQVGNLANRLAESADCNLKFSKEMKDFEEKKATLQTTIFVLKKRLTNVTATMESTRQQQMTILDDAITQEEMMAKCMESHADVVSESLAQEKAMETVKEEMTGMLEKMLDDANENRIKHLKIASGHGEHLKSMNASRASVLSCAQTVTMNVIGALEELDLSNLEEDIEKEVQMTLAARRPRPEALAQVDFEVREEVVETVDESVEVTAEEAPAPVEEAPEVVVSSPKNVLKIVTDTPEAEAAEETRTDAVTDVVQVENRVTAE
jgi:hypothetical protein